MQYNYTFSSVCISIYTVYRQYSLCILNNEIPQEVTNENAITRVCYLAQQKLSSNATVGLINAHL